MRARAIRGNFFSRYNKRKMRKGEFFNMIKVRFEKKALKYEKKIKI